MRQIIALLLLLCVGLSAPASGGPMRVCLASVVQASIEECCDGCGSSHDEHAPCCVELEKLPDAQVPAPMPVLPEVPVMDLGWQPIPVTRDLAAQAGRRELPDRIRGPTPAASRRAMLAIWRL